MKTYDGTADGGWLAQEIWSTADEIDVVTGGIESLTIDAENAFMVSDDYSSISATGATVYSDRVWDSQSSGNGYIIDSNEKAYNFIGWYYVYESTPCGSEAPARLLADGDEDDAAGSGEPAADPAPVAETPKDWATVCPTMIVGQSETPQIFVLGAISGLAVASAAILTAMLF